MWNGVVARSRHNPPPERSALQFVKMVHASSVSLNPNSSTAPELVPKLVKEIPPPPG
jgi:hypothetical protein